MDDATEIPLATASFLSQLTFWWLQPILVLGFKRTLVAEDLWKMDPSRQAGHLADLFEANFSRRKLEIEAWNAAIDDRSMQPSRARKVWWRVWHKMSGFGSPDGKREVGIAMALSDTFSWQVSCVAPRGVFFGNRRADSPSSRHLADVHLHAVLVRRFLQGEFSRPLLSRLPRVGRRSAALKTDDPCECPPQIVGDLAQVTSPLVTKQIIYFVTDSQESREGVTGIKDPSVGRVSSAYTLSPGPAWI